MKEKPILFNSAMVRAILDGRKTQTRRVLKIPTSGGLHEPWQIDRLCTITSPHPERGKFGMMLRRPLQKDDKRFEHRLIPCPYGRVGDELWVRETHFLTMTNHWPDLNPTHHVPKLHNEESVYNKYCFFKEGFDRSMGGIKWRPSIFMPRWASRIQLRIADIRVERVADISQSDAMAEGAPPSHPSIDCVSKGFGYPDFSRSWFGQLWDSINTDPGRTWADSPWVWVVEFERVRP